MLGLVRVANFVIDDCGYDVVIFRDYLFGEYVIQVYDVLVGKVVYRKTVRILPGLEEFMQLIKQLRKQRMVNVN